MCRAASTRRVALSCQTPRCRDLAFGLHDIGPSNDDVTGQLNHLRRGHIHRGAHPRRVRRPVTSVRQGVGPVIVGYQDLAIARGNPASRIPAAPQRHRAPDVRSPASRQRCQASHHRSGPNATDLVSAARHRRRAAISSRETPAQPPATSRARSWVHVPLLRKTHQFLFSQGFSRRYTIFLENISPRIIFAPVFSFDSVNRRGIERLLS